MFHLQSLYPETPENVKVSFLFDLHCKSIANLDLSRFFHYDIVSIMDIKITEIILLEFRDLGLIPYGQALDIQHQSCLQRQNDEINNTVLIVEHPPVITLGARKSENKLLAAEDEIKSRGIELIQVGRGGGCTAHNPGQLVFYPIIKLKTLNLSVNDYVRSLEQIGIELLQSLDIETDRRKGYPGLWIGTKKIASIGVQLKKWVTFHGMAINIQNDLSIFENIIPCGLENIKISSAQKETGKSVNMQTVKEKLKDLCISHWTHKQDRQ